MRENSKMILKDLSSFIMENGSTLTIQDGAEIIVEAGSTFIVKQGANLTIQGGGKLIIKDGAYLCIEQGANVLLMDYNSIIGMKDGASYGVNSLLFGGSSCQTSIAFAGDGSVVDYSQDVFIQNEMIGTNRYIGGRNIFVGHNVTTSKPQGSVVITNNSHVIFSATESVRLEAGFECKLGSSFEIK
jgi:hypothetical protein